MLRCSREDRHEESFQPFGKLIRELERVLVIIVLAANVAWSAVAVVATE
jgi:hypothetical protein